MIEKDAIKERLFDTLGWADRDWSIQLGTATYRILDYIVETQLRAGNSLILESTFDPIHDTTKVQGWIQQFGARVVQVLCHAEGSVLVSRFRERDTSSGRHPGQDQLDDLPGLEDRLHAGPAPFLEVDSARIQWNTTTFEADGEARILTRVCDEIGIEPPGPGPLSGTIDQ